MKKLISILLIAISLFSLTGATESFAAKSTRYRTETRIRTVTKRKRIAKRRAARKRTVRRRTTRRY